VVQTHPEEPGTQKGDKPHANPNNFRFHGTHHRPGGKLSESSGSRT
jgi:hypothetical protein